MQPNTQHNSLDLITGLIAWAYLHGALTCESVLAEQLPEGPAQHAVVALECDFADEAIGAYAAQFAPRPSDWNIGDFSPEVLS